MAEALFRDRRSATEVVEMLEADVIDVTDAQLRLSALDGVTIAMVANGPVS